MCHSELFYSSDNTFGVEIHTDFMKSTEVARHYQLHREGMRGRGRDRVDLSSTEVERKSARSVRSGMLGSKLRVQSTECFLHMGIVSI